MTEKGPLNKPSDSFGNHNHNSNNNNNNKQQKCSLCARTKATKHRLQGKDFSQGSAFRSLAVSRRSPLRRLALNAELIDWVQAWCGNQPLTKKKRPRWKGEDTVRHASEHATVERPTYSWGLARTTAVQAHFLSMFQEKKGNATKNSNPSKSIAATSQYTIKSLWLQWEWLVEASISLTPKLPCFMLPLPNWRLCTRNMRTIWKCEGLFCQHCRMAIPLPTWPWSKTGAMATVDDSGLINQVGRIP